MEEVSVSQIEYLSLIGSLLCFLLNANYCQNPFYFHVEYKSYENAYPIWVLYN